MRVIQFITYINSKDYTFEELIKYTHIDTGGKLKEVRHNYKKGLKDILDKKPPLFASEYHRAKI